MKWILLEVIALVLAAILLAASVVTLHYGDLTATVKLVTGAYFAFFAAYMFHP